MKTFDAKRFAEAIKAKMAGKLNYKKVAEEAGVHWCVVSRVYCEHDWHLMNIAEYHALCSWLGVPMETFFEETK